MLACFLLVIKPMALNLLKRIFGQENGAGSDLLLPADQFRTLILHECARCDRNAHAFSMIHVDLRDGDLGRNHSVRHLAKSLIHRMRTTDEIGWLDGHSVGVFLPETGKEGAQSLAQDACQGFAYQIFTYPWLSDVRPGAADGGSRNREQNRREPEPPQVSAEREGKGAQLAFHSGGSGAFRQTVNQSVGKNAGAKKTEAEKAFSMRSIEELILPDGAPSWKRAYDIVGSFILLVVFSPVLAAVAMYIKIVSPGPVFFRQERVGYLGRPFTMIKFRTMKTGSDNVTVHQDYLKDLIGNDDKAMTKLDTGIDNRLIPLAGLLRRTCIDELPQLVNVFRGDMSLVGPRPCLEYEAEEFASWQRRRFHTVPGMTGLWQVSGKNRLTFKEMMRLDIRYATRKSAGMDLMISLKTAPAILGQVRDAVKAKRSNVSSAPKATRAARRWSLHHFLRQLFL
jgi:lipopolysaccharide/colanic/teichoic acid biosynthesis glycosyltransferase